MPSELKWVISAITFMMLIAIMGGTKEQEIKAQVEIAKIQAASQNCKGVNK